MGTGYLVVDVFTGNRALPVSGANVTVKGNGGETLFNLVTNDNGSTVTVSLDAPNKENSLDPNNLGPYFSTCNVEVSANGFDNTIVHGVQIFDGETSILPVTMIPQSRERVQAAYVNVIDIPNNALNNPEKRRPETTHINSRILREVIIPENITVHLGAPSTPAENVSVPFIDYIKNVASSEIYPTWPQAALEANIYCQISFALNRVYTEWYPSRGFDFNITNSTAYDQFFVYGRNIFSNISAIVDRIFNIYIRRQGRREPFFAQYCNGTTSTCPGLSQWGTVPLANQGMTPLEILKYYFPDDIELVESNLIMGIPSSYPGTPLKLGSSGEDVRTMQNFLNRIQANYPLIPQIRNPDGVFGRDTEESVRVFQRTFHLLADGIIGRGTWFKISSIYGGIRRLSELDSEGQHIGISPTPPTSVIREGSRGEDVAQLQFLLNFISEFYPGVPTVIENASFDSRTKASVLAFQSLFGLTPDGVVGPGTWRRLYEIFLGIEDNVDIPPAPEVPETIIPPFPGSPLRIGSRGNDVLLIQRRLNGLAEVHPSIPRLTEDGIFGNGTHAAVVAFQNLFGLTPDGIVGRITWGRIMEEYNVLGSTPNSPPFPGVSLRTGSTGDNVLIMQSFLNRIAQTHTQLPTLVPDGVFGSRTHNAVLAFQRLFGLTADGIIGPMTWQAIVDEYNRLNGSIACAAEALQGSGSRKDKDIAEAMRLMMMGRMLRRR